VNVSATDLAHLRRCVELAREGLADGDEPFGSLLVSESGDVLFEDRNRVKNGDETRHPEFEIAKWSAAHLTPAQRASATVYTSGETSWSRTSPTPPSRYCGWGRWSSGRECSRIRRVTPSA
jgi:tRNA(Arg) A34 adenosine deaminase TadA